MSSDAEDEIPRETSAAAAQQGSGTALKASLAVLGLLFCFGVGLVGETYFRDWHAKPAQVTAQLPHSEAPRGPEIAAAPAQAPQAETKPVAVVKPPAATAPPRQAELPHPTVASAIGSNATDTATNAPVSGHELNPAEPSAASTLAALTPTAQPDGAPPASAAAAAATTAPPAASKQAVAATKAATKHSPRKVPATSVAASGLHYRVQFGAFAVEDNAQSLRHAIETPKLQITITGKADESGRTLYHVRSSAFASYNEALSAAHAAQDAAKRAQFGEAVQYIIQKIGEDDASASGQPPIQAAQSANH